MTLEELKEHVDAGQSLMIDIRLGKAFTEAHIARALSAPYSQRGWGRAVAGWLKREAPGQPVLLFGDNRVLVDAAKSALETEGIRITGTWDEGLDPWIAQGWPFVRVENITADALRASLSEWTVIDVREPYELRSGIIPGAKAIPMGELMERVTELDPSQRYAVVCASGSRSQSAAAWLAEQGYQVANLVGGMSLWIGGGLPVER